VICDRHDVVVVPFPFQEIPATKRRPAVICSGRVFNENNGWSVVSMITSAKALAWPGDMPITDLESAGLKVSCYIRPRFQTLPNEILVGLIGTLGPVDRLGWERQFASIVI